MMTKTYLPNPCGTLSNKLKIGRRYFLNIYIMTRVNRFGHNQFKVSEAMSRSFHSLVFIELIVYKEWEVHEEKVSS